ncbi:MAG: CidB/LrgB family autolysis modulator [Ferruginibacter sp.]|nr:CidB/LrgB family autolysis modulator [Ferruginibacter sp.]
MGKTQVGERDFRFFSEQPSSFLCSARCGDDAIFRHHQSTILAHYCFSDREHFTCASYYRLGSSIYEKNTMRTFFQTEIFAITFTFLVYFLAQKLQQKIKLIILNPILVSIIFIIGFLLLFKIDYSFYNEGGKMIQFFLKPAVVALGVPLYLQLEKIKKQALQIIVSQLVGCIVGVVSVVLIAKMMGASKQVIFSLAPKSVTTPIAMEVAHTIGGIPSLTAAVVIFIGIFGAIFGYALLKWLHITNPIAQGLSMGTAAHAVGTSRSMEISPTFGAYSGLGLIVNGILTASLTPYILQLLSYWVVF